MPDRAQQDFDTIRRNVVTLLNYACDPPSLCALPFSYALCKALAIPDPSTMVHALIERALQQDVNGRWLREALYLAHLSGYPTKTSAAHAMHISRRHFHRMYAAAVDRVAAYIAQTVTIQGPAELLLGNGPSILGRHDSEC